jgi:hypothetical protein
MQIDPCRDVRIGVAQTGQKIRPLSGYRQTSAGFQPAGREETGARNGLTRALGRKALCRMKSTNATFRPPDAGGDGPGSNAVDPACSIVATKHGAPRSCCGLPARLTVRDGNPVKGTPWSVGAPQVGRARHANCSVENREFLPNDAMSSEGRTRRPSV